MLYIIKRYPSDETEGINKTTKSNTDLSVWQSDSESYDLTESESVTEKRERSLLSKSDETQQVQLKLCLGVRFITKNRDTVFHCHYTNFKYREILNIYALLLKGTSWRSFNCISRDGSNKRRHACK